MRSGRSPDFQVCSVCWRSSSSLAFGVSCWQRRSLPGTWEVVWAPLPWYYHGFFSILSNQVERDVVSSMQWSFSFSNVQLVACASKTFM